MKKTLEKFARIKNSADIVDAKRREQRQRTLYNDPMTLQYKQTK